MFCEIGTTVKTDRFFVSGTDGLNRQGHKVFAVDTDGTYKLLWSGIRDECNYSEISVEYPYNTTGCDGANGTIYFFYNNIINKYNINDGTWSTVSHTNAMISGGGIFYALNSWNIDATKRLIIFYNRNSSSPTIGFNVFDITTEEFMYAGGLTRGSTTAFYNQAVYDSSTGECYFAFGYNLYKYNYTDNTDTYLGSSFSNNSMFLALYNGNIIGCSINKTDSIATLYYVNSTSGALTQYATIDFSDSAYADSISSSPYYTMKQIEDSLFLYASSVGLISINLDDNTFNDVVCNNLSSAILPANSSPIYCEYTDSLIYLDYYTNSKIRIYDF